MSQQYKSQHLLNPLSADHAIILPDIDDRSCGRYLVEIGAIVGSKQIHSVFKDNGQIKIYFTDKKYVKVITESGIIFNGGKTVKSAVLILSRVDPLIPDYYLENILKTYGSLESPIIRKKISQSLNFAHIDSGVREVKLKIYGGLKIPTKLHFIYEDVSYDIDVKVTEEIISELSGTVCTGNGLRAKPGKWHTSSLVNYNSSNSPVKIETFSECFNIDSKNYENYICPDVINLLVQAHDSCLPVKGYPFYSRVSHIYSSIQKNSKFPTIQDKQLSAFNKKFNNSRYNGVTEMNNILQEKRCLRSGSVILQQKKNSNHNNEIERCGVKDNTTITCKKNKQINSSIRSKIRPRLSDSSISASNSVVYHNNIPTKAVHNLSGKVHYNTIRAQRKKFTEKPVCDKIPSLSLESALLPNTASAPSSIQGRYPNDHNSDVNLYQLKGQSKIPGKDLHTKCRNSTESSPDVASISSSGNMSEKFVKSCASISSTQNNIIQTRMKKKVSKKSVACDKKTYPSLKSASPPNSTVAQPVCKNSNSTKLIPNKVSLKQPRTKSIVPKKSLKLKRRNCPNASSTLTHNTSVISLSSIKPKSTKSYSNNMGLSHHSANLRSKYMKQNQHRNKTPLYSQNKNIYEYEFDSCESDSDHVSYSKWKTLHFSPKKHQKFNSSLRNRNPPLQNVNIRCPLPSNLTLNSQIKKKNTKKDSAVRGKSTVNLFNQKGNFTGKFIPVKINKTAALHTPKTNANKKNIKRKNENLQSKGNLKSGASSTLKNSTKRKYVESSSEFFIENDVSKHKRLCITVKKRPSLDTNSLNASSRSTEMNLKDSAVASDCNAAKAKCLNMIAKEDTQSSKPVFHYRNGNISTVNSSDDRISKPLKRKVISLNSCDREIITVPKVIKNNTQIVPAQLCIGDSVSNTGSKQKVKEKQKELKFHNYLAIKEHSSCKIVFQKIYKKRSKKSLKRKGVVEKSRLKSSFKESHSGAENNKCPDNVNSSGNENAFVNNNFLPETEGEITALEKRNELCRIGTKNIDISILVNEVVESIAEENNNNEEDFHSCINGFLQQLANCNQQKLATVQDSQKSTEKIVQIKSSDAVQQVLCDAGKSFSEHCGNENISNMSECNGQPPTKVTVLVEEPSHVQQKRSNNADNDSVTLKKCSIEKILPAVLSDSVNEDSMPVTNCDMLTKVGKDNNSPRLETEENQLKIFFIKPLAEESSSNNLVDVQKHRCASSESVFSKISCECSLSTNDENADRCVFDEVSETNDAATLDHNAISNPVCEKHELGKGEIVSLTEFVSDSPNSCLNDPGINSDTFSPNLEFAVREIERADESLNTAAGTDFVAKHNVLIKCERSLSSTLCTIKSQNNSDSSGYIIDQLKLIPENSIKQELSGSSLIDETRSINELGEDLNSDSIPLSVPSENCVGYGIDLNIGNSNSEYSNSSTQESSENIRCIISNNVEKINLVDKVITIKQEPASSLNFENDMVYKPSIAYNCNSNVVLDSEPLDLSARNNDTINFQTDFHEDRMKQHLQNSPNSDRNSPMDSTHEFISSRCSLPHDIGVFKTDKTTVKIEVLKIPYEKDLRSEGTLTEVPSALLVSDTSNCVRNTITSTILMHQKHNDVSATPQIESTMFCNATNSEIAVNFLDHESDALLRNSSTKALCYADDSSNNNGGLGVQNKSQSSSKIESSLLTGINEIAKPKKQLTEMCARQKKKSILMNRRLSPLLKDGKRKPYHYSPPSVSIKNINGKGDSNAINSVEEKIALNVKVAAVLQMEENAKSRSVIDEDAVFPHVNLSQLEFSNNITVGVETNHTPLAIDKTKSASMSTPINMHKFTSPSVQETDLTYSKNETATNSTDTYIVKSVEVDYGDVYEDYESVSNLNNNRYSKSFTEFPLPKKEFFTFIDSVECSKNCKQLAMKVLARNKTPGAVKDLIIQLYAYFKVCEDDPEEQFRISQLIISLSDRKKKKLKRD